MCVCVFEAVGDPWVEVSSFLLPGPVSRSSYSGSLDSKRTWSLLDAPSESEQEEEENHREQEEEENLPDADSEWARPDVGVASKEAPAQNRSTEEGAEKATPQPNAKPKPKPQAATKKLSTGFALDLE